MTAPRVEVDLDAVEHNARTLVDRLAPLGIHVTGVTKGVGGAPEVAERMLSAGVAMLGESRMENVERLRAGGIAAPVLLVRSPMMSEVQQVVALTEASCNTEVRVVQALAAAATARRRVHGVVLMVELGDLREGILPEDLLAVAAAVLPLRGVQLRGIGANLACQHGVLPDPTNMALLDRLVGSVEEALALRLATVSGGSSVHLEWALSGAETGRVDDLRLGEAILLGVEPARRTPIAGLRTDAFRLVAEVIEAKVKPSAPWGRVGQAAFGPVPVPRDSGDRRRTILAVGQQDTDPSGLVPPPGMMVLGASSDHLLLDAGSTVLEVGDEVAFGLSYGSLVRATASCPTTYLTPTIA